MATSSTCNDSSNDSKIDDSSRVFRCVLGGILDDDSFSIPTEGNSTCLKLADTMVKMYGAPTVKCKEFGDWLITTLQEIIDTSRRQQGKKKGIINQEKLWSKYHQITTSSNFKDTWETFLSDFRLEKEPVFYQYFTDETFDILIKKAMAPVPEPLTNSPISFTFEEENAIRYVGGYVVRILRQHKSNTSICHIIEAMIDSNAIGPSQDWVKTIDRGGLVHISDQAFRLFVAIESSVRRYLTVKNATNMDSAFREYLTKCILDDPDVLFHWCLIGYADDELGETCLNHIVDKWITIRGFSFAKSMLEMYKLASKKGTEKAKSLRTKLFT